MGKPVFGNSFSESTYKDMLNPIRRDRNHGVLQGPSASPNEALVVASLYELKGSFEGTQLKLLELMDQKFSELKNGLHANMNIQPTVESTVELPSATSNFNETPVRNRPQSASQTSIFSYPNCSTIDVLWDVWNGLYHPSLKAMKHVSTSAKAQMGRDTYSKREKICTAIAKYPGSFKEQLEAFKTEHRDLYSRSSKLNQNKILSRIRAAEKLPATLDNELVPDPEFPSPESPSPVSPTTYRPSQYRHSISARSSTRRRRLPVGVVVVEREVGQINGPHLQSHVERGELRAPPQ